MTTYTYVARDDAGKLVEGEISAASPQDVARQVRAEGRFVVKVAPKGAGTKARRKPPVSGAAAVKSGAQATGGITGMTIGGKKFRPDDVIFFTNQLAVMIDTGVSMSEALAACRHDGNSPRFADVLEDVIDRVEGGSEFSAALAEHPKIFPPLYISLIKASEASGLMGPILRRLAETLQTQREVRKKIKGAVTYPIVMFVFAIGVTIFLLTWVLPKFTTIYAGREDRLPTATRVLLGFTENLMAYGLYVLGAVIVAAGVAVYYFRTPAGRLRLESIKLMVPLFGPLFHKTYLARSLRTLGTMIQSGVSMLDSVNLTAGVCGSHRYHAMWNQVQQRLETGKQLSEALSEHKCVPKSLNKMLAAGERSGQLGPVMERVAVYCENELNTAIKTMTSMIEPAIVMFLGAVVGGLVLALLLPIFTISKAMN